MKSKFKYKGFTLVELLIVITILGILAAIAIPRLFPQTEKARVAEAINILSAIRQAQEAYFLQHGRYCDTNDGCLWDDLGMGNPNDDAKYFTYSYLGGFDKEAEEEGGGEATTVTAVARRLTEAENPNAKNPNNQFSGTIQLDERGKFTCYAGRGGGVYPYCPTG